MSFVGGSILYGIINIFILIVPVVLGIWLITKVNSIDRSLKDIARKLEDRQ